MYLPTAPAAMWDAHLPRAENELQLALELESWIRSEPLRALAAAWGGVVPRGDHDVLKLYDWFDQFSATHWDFRRGRERSLALESGLTTEQVRASHDSSEALGMVDALRPSRQDYDYVLVLGGLARACLTRPRFVAELVGRGIKFGEIVALGGTRPLGDAEKAFARSHGLDVASEFDALIEGVMLAFGISERPDIITGSSRGNVEFSGSASARFGTRSISVIAAPSTEPGSRRANTADTFTWWADKAAPLDGKHVLIVTAAIYVPYQSASAIENLGITFNASTETVGISADAARLGGRTQAFSSEDYLQEIRSAIRGYRSLYAKLRSAVVLHGS